MSKVVLHQVEKKFGSVTAVTDINLDIEAGSLVALLGPSGCGKTTCLRMLAGFITPSQGRITVDGADITHVPPHKRNTAMVFQSYALFPHLSVENNIAYGMKRRGVEREEIKRRVAEVLDLVRIPHLADRSPAALSGGQKQRVAVARALVLRPDLLLLDEPFSALDAQVRESTRIELRRIQQQTGITALLVTHDQSEAMSIADKIVVMSNGRIEQVGTPFEIYDRPASKFVAEFIGSANILPGHVISRANGTIGFSTELGIDIEIDSSDKPHNPGASHAVLRSEDIRISEESEDRLPEVNACRGTVVVSSFLGTTSEVVVTHASNFEFRLLGDRSLASRFTAGQPVRLSWSGAEVRLVNA